MSLIPKTLRPMTVIRRKAMRKGLRGNSRVWRAVAVIVLVRTDIVRHAALREGVYGKSRFWRGIALMLFANDAVRAVTVKAPEQLGVERLAPGQTVQVSAVGPRQRRRARAAS
jgi:hypothetical protein